jgi:hypothetical protein
MCVQGGKSMSEETPRTEINARGDDTTAKPHQEQDEGGFGNMELPDGRRVAAETDEEGSFGDTEPPEERA